MAVAKSVAAAAGYRHPRALDGDLNRFVITQKNEVPPLPSRCTSPSGHGLALLGDCISYNIALNPNPCWVTPCCCRVRGMNKW